MSCFILHKGVTGAIYSIQHNNRQTIVAFETKKQAGTYKRLINEMNKHKHNNKLKIESRTIESMERSCKVVALDLIIFKDDGTSKLMTACQTVNDDMRFALENTYRYGNHVVGHE